MNSTHKNSLLATAIVSGIVSLPMTWLTIRSPVSRIEGELGEMFNSALQGVTFTVTGLNGRVTFLVETPIWFVIGVAVAANAIQIVRSSKAVDMPKLVPWLVAIVSAIWMSIPIPVVLLSGDATLGIGWIFGMFCAAIPIVCLLLPDSTYSATGRDSNKNSS